MKRLRLGLLLLAMAGMVAAIVVHQSEKISKHEDDWRNRHSDRFEQDYVMRRLHGDNN